MRWFYLGYTGPCFNQYTQNIRKMTFSIYLNPNQFTSRFRELFPNLKIMYLGGKFSRCEITCAADLGTRVMLEPS